MPKGEESCNSGNRSEKDGKGGKIYEMRAGSDNNCPCNRSSVHDKHGNTLFVEGGQYAHGEAAAGHCEDGVDYYESSFEGIRGVD